MMVSPKKGPEFFSENQFFYRSPVISKWYNTPRYWYHVSSYLKKEGSFLLKPWKMSRSRYRSINEPDISRISVAPSVAHCLVAIPLEEEAIRVYRTVIKTTAFFPWHIYDAHVTCEGWLTKPTEFQFVGSLNVKEIMKANNLNFGVLPSGNQQVKALKWWWNFLSKNNQTFLEC